MAKRNVLVVEDDETIRRLLIEYLTGKSRRLHVDGARDGVEALHQISAHRYGVVVLDLLMPFMSGVDLLHSLQALMTDPSAGKLPARPEVLVITSASPEDVAREDLQRRFPLFVEDVLRKPLDLPRLGDRVLTILDRKTT